MRIKVKWTSCGHRKKMALICFYAYADGYRQSVGYICDDCIRSQTPTDLRLGWIEMSTWKVHYYRALYPDQIGDVQVVFTRVSGMEAVLPDERLYALPAELEARKLTVARQSIEGFHRAGYRTAAPEAIAQGIAFAVETGASPADYKR